MLVGGNIKIEGEDENAADKAEENDAVPEGEAVGAGDPDQVLRGVDNGFSLCGESKLGVVDLRTDLTEVGKLLTGDRPAVDGDGEVVIFGVGFENAVSFHLVGVEGGEAKLRAVPCFHDAEGNQIGNAGKGKTQGEADDDGGKNHENERFEEGEDGGEVPP